MSTPKIEKAEIAHLVELHRIAKDRVRRAAQAARRELKRSQEGVTYADPEQAERRYRNLCVEHRALAVAANMMITAYKAQEAEACRRHDEAMRSHLEVTGMAERAPDAEMVAAIATEMGKPITDRRARAWAAKLAHVANWHEALERLIRGAK